MKKKISIVGVILLLTVMLCSCSSIASFWTGGGAGSNVVHIDIDDLQTSNVAAVVANNAISSCVRIQVELTSGTELQGAGFIITKDGYVITNRHVVVQYSSGKDYQTSITDKIKSIKTIKVVFADNTYYEAERIAYCAETAKDIAILKMKNTNGKEFQPLTFDTTTQLYYGQDAYTFGNPEGLGLLFSHASIAAPNFTVKTSVTTYENVIMLDANINHGNSGGVLLNTDSNIIGLVYGRIEATNSSVNNVYGVGCALSAKTIVDYIDNSGYKSSIDYLLYTKTPDEAESGV